jgi:hypothetical protein
MAGAARYRDNRNRGINDQRVRKTFPKMTWDIGESLSNIARSNNGDDGADEDDAETEQGQRSEDDEPGCAMGRFTTTVQQR